MPSSLLAAASSSLRRAYRALIPAGMRKGIRRRVASRPPKAAVRPRGGPRLFELPLPRREEPWGTEPLTRDTLIIEAPRRFYVTRQLRQGGVAGYEASTAAVMLGAAEWVRPEVVFDVGANMGPHALLIPALLNVPVVAFEPAADVAAALRHIVDVNGLRCTVVEIAVGERDETATLFISPTDTSTSLRKGFRSATGAITVPVRTLDTYVDDSGLRPTLLKIDTETTEPAVLRGASRLLASRPWIVCEILPGWTETEIENLLMPLGYTAFQIVDTWPLPRRERIEGHASFEHANWLFAPEAPPPVLWDAVLGWRRAIEACALPRDLPAPPRA